MYEFELVVQPPRGPALHNLCVVAARPAEDTLFTLTVLTPQDRWPQVGQHRAPGPAACLSVANTAAPGFPPRLPRLPAAGLLGGWAVQREKQLREVARSFQLVPR